MKPNPSNSAAAAHALEVSYRLRDLASVRLWTWPAIGLSVATCLVITWLHFSQQATVNRSSRLLSELREARIELAQGFLYLTLSDDTASPFSRENAMALMAQAAETLEAAESEIASSAMASNEAALQAGFTAKLQEFRRQLAAYNGGTPEARRDLKLPLRLSYHELDQIALRVDQASQQNLQNLMSSQHQRFEMMLAAAIGLMSLMCAGVYRGGRRQTAALLALRSSKETLKETNRFLTDLIERSSAIVFIKDKEGHYELVNRKWEEVTGLHREQAMGQTDQQLFPGAIGDQFWENDRKVLNSGQPVEAEEIVADKSGERAFLSIKFPVCAGDGSIRGVCGMATEVTERKRAEAAVRERAQQLRLFVEHSPAAIAMLDRDMCYLMASRRWKSDYRLGDRDIIGRSHYDIFPDVPARWQEIHRRCLAGAVEKNEADPFPRADGALDWVRWECRPWFSEQGDVGGIIIFSELITERKQAEEALRQSEASLESFLNTTATGLVRNSRDLRYQSANAAYARMVNRHMDQIIGHSLTEVLGERAVAKIQPYIDRVLAGERVEYESALPLPDQSECWIHAVYTPDRAPDGGIAGWVGSVTDITARKQAEQGRAQLAAIVESSEDAIVGKDLNGVVTSWNHGAEKLFGFTAAEMIGQSVLKLFPPERVPEEQEILARIQRGEVVEHFETVRVSKDGRRRDVSVTISPIRDASGQIVGASKIARDITARKRAEEEIHRQAGLIKSLLDSIPDLIFYKSPQGVYLGGNPAFASFVGRPSEEIIGKTDHDLLPKEVADEFRGFDRKMLECLQSQRNEEWVTYPDGRRVLLDTLKTPYWGSEGKVLGVLGISRDITERQQAEEALRQSEASLRHFLNTAEVGLIRCSRDLHYTLANAAYARLVGRPADQIMGRSIAEIVGESVLTTVRPLIERVLGGERVEFESQLNYAASGPRWVHTIYSPDYDSDGKVAGWVASVTDVTERKRAELALRESNERLKKVLEVETVGVMFWDLTTGEMTDANDTFLRTMGYSRREIEARELTWQKLTPPEFLEVSRAEVKKFMVTGRVGPYEKEYLRKDGARQWLLFAGSSLGNNACVEFCVDISAQKAAEAALRDLNRTLEQRVQERTAELRAANEELDAFVYAVSHDLRAPLRAMNGFSQALREDFASQLPPAAGEYLDYIQQGSREMGALIDGLLRLSRVTRADLDFQAVDVSALATRLLAQLQKHEPERNVTCTVAPNLRADGDARLLEIVFTNLLGNAWKYSAGNSQAAIRVFGQTDDHHATFSVADNGAGFDMKHAARLFQPFQRLHRDDEFPGLGIGLATVQRIVRRHGGQIQAAAAPGQGATFTLKLPLVKTS